MHQMNSSFVVSSSLIWSILVNDCCTLPSPISAKNIHSSSFSENFFFDTDRLIVQWLIFRNGLFMVHFAALWYKHIPPSSRWVLFEDKRPVNLWTMAQWIKHNMCGQEYQELLWVSLLSTSHGTPEIIVHRLLVFKLAMPEFVIPPALTHSVLSWGHVFGDVPYLESYLKPFYQLKLTWWTSLSVVSQLPRWILQQVSKCQESSMFFLPQLLRGVNSVISTCGMWQCDQRARAKHGSMLKWSFITTPWLHCSDKGFLFNRAAESDITAVSAVCRYGGLGKPVYQTWVLVFSQP